MQVESIRQHPEVRWDLSEIQAISSGKALSRPLPEVLRSSIPAQLHSTTFDFPATRDSGKRLVRVTPPRNYFTITVKHKKSVSPPRSSLAVKSEFNRGVTRAVSLRRNRVKSTEKLYSPRPTFPVNKHIKKTQTSPYRIRALPKNCLSPSRIATINLGCKLPEFVGEEEQDEGHPAPVPSAKEPDLLERLKDSKELPTPVSGRINPIVKILAQPLKKLKKAKTIRDDSFTISAWKVPTPRNF